MAPIRVLDTEVVNKIAAGEVIERPSSVVKELVENSLDAGATEVRVEVEEGGRKLVRVSDNGEGIPPQELPLAFAPHATSKLSSAEDLFRIATFGFRGEALASIGAVAQVCLRSRPRGSEEGAELEVEGGRLSAVRPAASAPGTQVEVRNLFGNVPVRRKFLRSVAIETEHVVEAFSRFAAAHPDVRLELVVDGELRHALPPASRRDRLSLFFGREVAQALKEVDGSGFRAYVAPPQHSKASPRGIYFFLNGRYIRDRVLLRAVHEAYRELLPHDRSPVAFVFLELSSQEADVNVHPTKIEVRFRNVWPLHDRLVAALRGALLEGGIDPVIAPESLPRESGGSARAVVDFFSHRAPEGQSEGASAPVALAQERPLVTVGRRVFQLHNRYLVEETEDGLRIIDQHALHERVLLEEFRRQYARGEIARQRLLLPAVVALPPEKRSRLEAQRELLLSFGLEVEEFGRDSVRIRAVPALVADQDPASLLGDFLDLAEEDASGEPLQERTLEFMACRAAIKFGRKLADEEILRLLQDAAGLDFSSSCAHGRPTGIKLTLLDLERFFHR